MRDLEDLTTPPASPSLPNSSPTTWSPAVVLEKIKTVVKSRPWSKVPPPVTPSTTQSSSSRPTLPTSTPVRRVTFSTPLADYINEDQIDISVAESHLDLSTEQLIQEDASTIKDLETTVTIEDASFICDICGNQFDTTLLK